MNWNIKDHGDAIERLASLKLEESLVLAYNNFWGRYIGHDKGNPVPILEITEEHNELRLKLGQWCYVLLQNQTFLSIMKAPSNIKGKEYEKVANSLRLFLESTHLVYNGIELIEDFNQDVIKEGFSELQFELANYRGFKNFRNILAHNIRPFVEIPLKGALLVPQNFNAFSDSSAHDRWIWPLESKKFDKVDYWPLNEYLENLRQTNKNFLCHLLDKSTRILTSKIGNKRIPLFESDYRYSVEKSLSKPIKLFVSGSRPEDGI